MKAARAIAQRATPRIVTDHGTLELSRAAPTTTAGDRMYVATIADEAPGANGLVRAYDTKTGALRTVLVPGREVAYRSGWLDIQPYSIAATQLPDGRRFLFTEELTSSRILLYRGF